MLLIVARIALVFWMHFPLIFTIVNAGPTNMSAPRALEEVPECDIVDTPMDVKSSG